MTLTDIRDMLLAVSPDVYHYHAKDKPDRYIVWAEDGQSGALHGDDRMDTQRIQGTIDLYSKNEYDPLIGQIQQALNTGEISWRLNSVQHEQDTGYIHYEWVWDIELGV